MQAVLIIIHLFVAIALIFVVLLQRSEGGALGMGGGGSGLGGLFSPRGAASTLSRTTAILGIAFFATSLALTLLALGGRRPASILNPTTVPGTQIPGTPGSPPTLPSRQYPTLPGTNPAGRIPAAPGTAAPAAPTLPSVPPAR
jgi:preprotein translocase subunit SecG